ncbi:MAG: CPBP family glutamic-type intramembrane protease [Promethearchaeota archaeon]|jgi:membrane protease YdiL (CAAX protease family)
MKQIKTSSSNDREFHNKKSRDSYSIIFYFLLSYVIFWGLGYFFSLIFAGILHEDYNISIKIIVYILLILPGAGPFLSALIVIRITEGKAGLQNFFRHLIKVKVKFYWYLIVFFFPIIAYIIPKLFLLLNGNTIQDVFIDKISWNISWIVIFDLSIAGIQEEPGWRGYAVPKLNVKFNPIITSFIIGILWAFWHFNFYWSGVRSISSFPEFLFLVIILSIIYTWIYINTESIPLVIIFHAMHNVCAGIFTDFPGTFFIALVYLFFVIVILIKFSLKMRIKTK